MASYSERGGYCGYCEERVLVRRRAPNHILHLLLTACTMGFWLIVWLGNSIQAGGWRCPQCGSKASTRIPRLVKAKKAA